MAKFQNMCEQDVFYTLKHYFPDGGKAGEVIDRCCNISNKPRYHKDGTETQYAIGLRYARMKLVERGVMKPHPYGGNRHKSLWRLR